MDKMNSAYDEIENNLDHNSPIPLHYQLKEIIRSNILAGKLVGQDGKVPTETELSNRFKVSRITVRTAMEALVNEGLLWRKRGSGTYLNTNRVENWVGKLMGFSETISAAGFSPNGKVLDKGMTQKLPKAICEQLQTTKAWRFKRLRFANTQPIAIEESFFIPEIGSVLEMQGDLDNMITYRFIEQDLKIGLHEAKQLITAVNASKEEALMLNIFERDALLYIERLTKSQDGKPIEFLKAKYRPDYFQYVIQLHRQIRT
ncbi:GntR family transcriptional regulator [Fodinisporobacter ferrooxydans]|uniref:GntR family transcriptional regulator n=1 Tax=Fodinisporobacter ferrooxydans TaxID=2901836 RepID=A0ABY4CJK7_9BACL|nr:GntR family transcriptional regulator [Alicyclobacillaceae bacterium MYW30-H2]